jgi:RimJ/RimL family protein N-acetyltransferase
MVAMEIRLTEEKDIPAVLGIYDQARVFMKENGNPTQWTTGAPDKASLSRDLERRVSYVVWDNGVIVGTFALITPDPNYGEIRGRWLNEEPYIAIHRMASIKRGVGTFVLTEVCSKYKNVRIDTHRDNVPMRNLLRKMGFVHCGVIVLLDKDNSPREAYMKTNSL